MVDFYKQFQCFTNDLEKLGLITQGQANLLELIELSTFAELAEDALTQEICRQSLKDTIIYQEINKKFSDKFGAEWYTKRSAWQAFMLLARSVAVYGKPGENLYLGILGNPATTASTIARDFTDFETITNSEILLPV